MARSLEAVSVDQLEKFLVCSICLETLEDPRTLPCFHSYCNCCLEKYVKNHRDKAVIGLRQMKEFNCPTCRSKFTLNLEEKVADMTTNHFVRNMLDVMAVQNRIKVVPCSHCEGASVGRCVTCEVFLCQECLTNHNKYLGFQEHSLLTMIELSKPENQRKIRGKLYCKEHPKKVLKYYCETCSDLICRHCMDFNHLKANHSCLPVEEVADTQKELLASDCSTFAMELKRGKEALKAISDVTQSLEREKEQVKRDIYRRKNAILNVVTQQLNVEVERLTGQVDEIYNTKHATLTKQKVEVKRYVDKLESCVNLSTGLLQKGTSEEIISSSKMIKENMVKVQTENPKNLKPNDDDKINYKCGPLKIEIHDQMGRVEDLKMTRKYRIENRDGQLTHMLFNKVTLIVYQGDITEEKTDAIVNPANEDLRHYGGAAEAISKQGGKSIQDECDDIMKKRQILQPGDIEITTAGKLPCRFIVHAVGPRWCNHSADKCRKLLQKAVRVSLKIASENNAQTIAIPAISSGVFGVPVEVCAEVLFDSVEKFAKAAADSEKLKEIRFVNIDKATTQVFEKEMRKRYGEAIGVEKAEGIIKTK